MTGRRRISLTTVVWGTALIVIAVLVAGAAIAGFPIDPLIAAAILLLAAGLTLIAGAAFGGRRRAS